MNIRFEPLSHGLTKQLSDKLEPVYIGDPCYIVPDEDWDDFCSALFKVQEKHDGSYVAFLDDKPAFIVGSTRHGDGCYPVYKNKTRIGFFGVDAGLFSLIPQSVFLNWEVSISHGDSVVVDLQMNGCWYDDLDRGNLEFDMGNVTYLIDTAGTETAVEDEEYFPEDEEV